MAATVLLVLLVPLVLLEALEALVRQARTLPKGRLGQTVRPPQVAQTIIMLPHTLHMPQEPIITTTTQPGTLTNMDTRLLLMKAQRGITGRALIGTMAGTTTIPTTMAHTVEFITGMGTTGMRGVHIMMVLDTGLTTHHMVTKSLMATIATMSHLEMATTIHWCTTVRLVATMVTYMPILGFHTTVIPMVTTHLRMPTITTILRAAQTQMHLHIMPVVLVE